MRIPALIEQQKHIFGTYTAMALKNIQTVLDHIQKVTNLPNIVYEEKKVDENEKKTKNPGPEDFWAHSVIVHLQDKTKLYRLPPEKTCLIIEKLLRNFPFLKIMAEGQRDHENKKAKVRNKDEGTSVPLRSEINGSDICYVLNNMFRVLKAYRDSTVHSVTTDDKFIDGSRFLKTNESQLSFTINNYYTAALRNVKERYNYSTQDLAFIQDYRINRKTKKTDFGFFLSMQSFNDDKTKCVHLSGVGVTQLICLFLEKKYINTFLSKLPVFGNYSEASEERRIIRRSLSINSVVLPKERIRSDKKGMSIAMDMLNELKRCPKELLGTLSNENQERFRTMSTDYNEVLLMRSTDRFAQLALQYIDYNSLFKSIRFHVNMGKLRYLFSPEKKCIDGQVRVRVLEQPLNGYGRLEDMETFRRLGGDTYGNTGIRIRDFENIQRDDSCPDNYPYVVDTYTHYLLNNNKIEMKFCTSKVVPDIRNNNNGKWRVEKDIPCCRMSVLELPAMMFHMHLLGNEKTEKRIRDVYNNYKKLFTALSNGTLTKENIGSFNIAASDMPKKVIDAVNKVSRRKSFKGYSLETIKELLDETKRLQESFKQDKKTVNSSQNKLGKRNYKVIQPGKLAEYLAKDIVKFQPSLRSGEEYGTDRLTGMNFRVMQATIATYSCADDNDAYSNLCSMFRSASLIDGEARRNHPFLKSALSRRPKNTLDFYENYLSARKNYLNRLLEKLNEGENIAIPFINREQNKWAQRDEDYYQLMGEIYNEDIAMELPRQMFDEEIKDALKAMPQMKDVDYDNANVTYLIGEYLKRVHNDNFQDFYDWERNYRYMDLLACKVNNKNNSIVAQYLTTAERENAWENRTEGIKQYTEWSLSKKKTDRNLRTLSDAEYDNIIAHRLSSCRNDFQKNEKIIRRYQVQDALMFFMVKETLTKHISFTAKNFKLKDIMPDSDKGLLSESMPMEFIFEKGGKTYTIKSKGMKLKNYGDFFTIAHDKRLSSLLNLLSTRSVDKDEIEQEFSNYDTIRPEAVRLVFDFEKMVYDRYPEIQKMALANHRFDFKELLDELIKRGDIIEQEKEILRLIRNAFNHNAYPPNGIVEIRTLPEIARHLIKTFGKYTQKI